MHQSKSTNHAQIHHNGTVELKSRSDTLMILACAKNIHTQTKMLKFSSLIISQDHYLNTQTANHKGVEQKTNINHGQSNTKSRFKDHQRHDTLQKR